MFDGRWRTRLRDCEADCSFQNDPAIKTVYAVFGVARLLLTGIFCLQRPASRVSGATSLERVKRQMDGVFYAHL